jgi:hypothetical protein
MSRTFTLHFTYKGIPQQINCVLRTSTYTYQFLCEIDKNELIVEKDDEGNWRVIKADPFSVNKMKTDPGLVEALLTEMEKVLE